MYLGFTDLLYWQKKIFKLFTDFMLFEIGNRNKGLYVMTVIILGFMTWKCNI